MTLTELKQQEALYRLRRHRFAHRWWSCGPATAAGSVPDCDDQEGDAGKAAPSASGNGQAPDRAPDGEAG